MFLPQVKSTQLFEWLHVSPFEGNPYSLGGLKPLLGLLGLYST
jgi:hypothetical protein